MALWPNQSDADKKYNDLLNNIKIIPRSTNTLVGVLPCDDPTSFFYNRLEDATGNQYAVLAVHMETEEDVTYFTGADFIDATKIINLMDNSRMK